MPRYYFHLEDGVSIEDDEGLELVDAAEARLEAVRFGGSMLRDFPEHETWTVIVADADGSEVFRLLFSVR